MMVAPSGVFGERRLTVSLSVLIWSSMKAVQFRRSTIYISFDIWLVQWNQTRLKASSLIVNAVSLGHSFKFSGSIVF